jgi:hypothetical protein
MSKFELLIDALEPYFDKRLVEMPGQLRQLLRLRNWPPGSSRVPAAFAIIFKASTKNQGTWQYRNDGESTWMDIPEPPKLSDTNAIIIRRQSELRFNPARLHPHAQEGELGSMGDWYGTPGCLTARIWYGTGDPPASGTQNISPSIGAIGQWSIDTANIINTASGPVPSGNALVTPLWDELSVDRRRQLAFQRDCWYHPENEEDQELVFNIGEKKLHLEKQTAETYEGEKQKERELAELNNQAKRIDERMTNRVLGTVASEKTSRSAMEWLVNELSRRAQSGEDTRRPAMLIALGSEFPDLGKEEGRRLFTCLPREIKAKRGRKTGWRKKGPI